LLKSTRGLFVFFSCSHPALVCLCRITISTNLQSLLEDKTLWYRDYIHFPVERLHEATYGYNTFRSVVHLLRLAKDENAVHLLRSRVLGFLVDVSLRRRGSSRGLPHGARCIAETGSCGTGSMHHIGSCGWIAADVRHRVYLSE
jgi:hypothetical protein